MKKCKECGKRIWPFGLNFRPYCSRVCFDKGMEKQSTLAAEIRYEWRKYRENRWKESCGIPKFLTLTDNPENFKLKEPKMSDCEKKCKRCVSYKAASLFCLNKRDAGNAYCNNTREDGFVQDFHLERQRNPSSRCVLAGYKYFKARSCDSCKHHEFIVALHICHRTGMKGYFTDHPKSWVRSKCNPDYTGWEPKEETCEDLTGGKSLNIVCEDYFDIFEDEWVDYGVNMLDKMNRGKPHMIYYSSPRNKNGWIYEQYMNYKKETEKMSVMKNSMCGSTKPKYRVARSFSGLDLVKAGIPAKGLEHYLTLFNFSATVNEDAGFGFLKYIANGTVPKAGVKWFEEKGFIEKGEERKCEDCWKFMPNREVCHNGYFQDHVNKWPASACERHCSWEKQERR